VSLDAFMVAGGGVLAWMGFSMLSGQGSSFAPPDDLKFWGVADALSPLRGKPGHHHRRNYTLCGPFTVVFRSRPRSSRRGEVVTWLALLLVARTAGKGEGGFARDMIARFMGLIVLSMGIQFALTGLRQFGT
jgi:multiple antibiotic resistance protein